MNISPRFTAVITTASLIAIISGCAPKNVITEIPATNTLAPENTASPVPYTTVEATATLDVFPTLIASMPEEVTDAQGIRMRLIPAGEFTMGSDLINSERPIHTVYLVSFYMDVYEVTNQAYKKCVEAGACNKPFLVSSSTHFDYFDNPEFANYPVITVTWRMAKSYCEWRGSRLPTEAEWEKAARGTDARLYPWGDNYSCDFANMVIQGVPCVGDTTEVGSYASGISPYGIYDMAGNVGEWTSSVLKPYPYDANDGREGQTAAQTFHVVRGGGWYYIDETYSRTSKRNELPPNTHDPDIGFRCAR